MNLVQGACRTKALYRSLDAAAWLGSAARRTRGRCQGAGVRECAVRGAGVKGRVSGVMTVVVTTGVPVEVVVLVAAEAIGEQ